MGTKIIIVFLISIVFLVIDGDESRKDISDSSVDNYESPDARLAINKNFQNKPTQPVSRSASKMPQMLLQSDEESFSDTENNDDVDPFEEGNRKIMKFAKRIIESIKKYGIRGKDDRLSKSGKYRIDWWKQDRRLERMRKRLSEELDRNPELKIRLGSLGWRNSSATVSHQKNINTDNKHFSKKPAINLNDDLKNTVLYKTLVTAFQSLMDAESSKGEMTGRKESRIFLYMPIMITSSASEINQINEAAITRLAESDAPMKISIETFNDPDFEKISSDFGVVDVMSGGKSISDDEDLISASHSTGQVMDSDRLLQLIPLVVEEVRKGRMPEEERQAFNWIFGRRLWQLIEREASKLPRETMDQDMAMFLLKGELPERDPKNDNRKRRQRRNALDRRQPKIVSPINAQNDKKELDYDYTEDYDFEDTDEEESNNDHLKRTDDLPWKNLDQDGSFRELIELAAKHRSRKLEAAKKEKANKNRKKEERMNKWINTDYENYSYNDDIY